MPRTTRGKVVYKRIRHEFSIRDATRIIRNLDPLAEEALDFQPFVEQTSLLAVRVIRAVLRSLPEEAEELTGVAQLVANIMEALISRSAEKSEDLRNRIISIFKVLIPED